LSRRFGHHFDRHFGEKNHTFWNNILRVQFKFEPNRFINGSVKANQGLSRHLGRHLDRYFGNLSFVFLALYSTCTV